MSPAEQAPRAYQIRHFEMLRLRRQAVLRSVPGSQFQRKRRRLPESRIPFLQGGGSQPETRSRIFGGKTINFEEKK